MHRPNFHSAHMYFVQTLKLDSLNEDDTALVTPLQELLSKLQILFALSGVELF